MLLESIYFISFFINFQMKIAEQFLAYHDNSV